MTDYRLRATVTYTVEYDAPVDLTDAEMRYEAALDRCELEDGSPPYLYGTPAKTVKVEVVR